MDLNAKRLCLFLTGYPAAGKTTLATELIRRLPAPITFIDGNDFRRKFSPDLGFSRHDRARHMMRIAMIAGEVIKHGGTIVISVVAPYDDQRRMVARAVQAAGGRFLLIHVDTPLEVCRKRDPEGLYLRAMNGEIADFTGVDGPYEIPREADIRIDMTQAPVEPTADYILQQINNHLDKAAQSDG